MSNWQYLIKSFNCPIVHSRPPRDLYIILIAINQTKDFNRQSVREMFGWGWRSEIIFQGWPDVTRGDMHVFISSAALCRDLSIYSTTAKHSEALFTHESFQKVLKHPLSPLNYHFHTLSQLSFLSLLPLHQTEEQSKRTETQGQRIDPSQILIWKGVEVQNLLLYTRTTCIFLCEILFAAIS